MLNYNYLINEEDFLTTLYNLILDINTNDIERKVYLKARDLVEIEKMYYHAVIFQLLPALSYVAKKQKLSKNGTKFMMELAKFSTNMGASFILFESILK